MLDNYACIRPLYVPAIDRISTMRRNFAPRATWTHLFRERLSAKFFRKRENVYGIVQNDGDQKWKIRFFNDF